MMYTLLLIISIAPDTTVDPPTFPTYTIQQPDLATCQELVKKLSRSDKEKAVCIQVPKDSN